MDPAADAAGAVPGDAGLREALQRVWGYSAFRPLQREGFVQVIQALWLDGLAAAFAAAKNAPEKTHGLRR